MKRILVLVIGSVLVFNCNGQALKTDSCIVNDISLLLLDTKPYGTLMFDYPNKEPQFINLNILSPCYFVRDNDNAIQNMTFPLLDSKKVLIILGDTSVRKQDIIDLNLDKNLLYGNSIQGVSIYYDTVIAEGALTGAIYSAKGFYDAQVYISLLLELRTQREIIDGKKHYTDSIMFKQYEK